MIKKITHHTVTDWDFQAGISKALDPTYFVSPPTSLKLSYILGTPDPGIILCRVASTLCLPQLEVRTWHRGRLYSRTFHLAFRNQAALGTANWLNCYFWEITGSWKYFYRKNAGIPTLIGQFNVATGTYNVWYHWRTIAKNGFDTLGNPALCTELYWEVAGAWVKLGTTLYDLVNQWKDSAINRCGIGSILSTTNPRNFDDTEIWGPA